MIEFLTENALRAYPLEREWPEALRERWAGTLVDACVYSSAELGDGRVELLAVRKRTGALEFIVGIQGGDQIVVSARAGLSGFTTVYAGNASLKALLTVDGKAVDALALDDRYPTSELAVNVPFAMRCAGGAERRVTSISAQGAAQGTTPVYGNGDADMVEKSVGAGEHAVLKAYDGVDLEVVGTASLLRNVLRVSAIAAPETSEAEEEPIDIMIRGDECFTVDAEPGKDGKSGTIRIGNVCKPCCQCEDYGDAIGLLRPSEAKAWELNAELDRVEAAYRIALARFEEAKASIVDSVNSPDNVRTSATAVGSGGMYDQSTAAGTRNRLAVTLFVENMTMLKATVSVGDDGVDADKVPNSGFAIAGYTHAKTSWTKSGNVPTRGTGRPMAVTLEPGETLSLTAVYVKTGNTNTAPRPENMQAFCTVAVNGKEPVERKVPVK